MPEDKMTPYSVLKLSPETWAKATENLKKMATRHLIPVRRGGPWKFCSKCWEVWADGDARCCAHTKEDCRVRGGMVEARLGGNWCNMWEGVLINPELRPPEDWDGPMPEGCRPAEDFVAGQRVRFAPPGCAPKLDGGIETPVDCTVNSIALDVSDYAAVMWPGEKVCILLERRYLEAY